MTSSLLPTARWLVSYGVGYLLSSAVFSVIYMLLYSGTVPGIIVLLGIPVASFYFVLLALARYYTATFVSSVSVLPCGTAVGLFPTLGLWPIYMWRLTFAIVLFLIHVNSRGGTRVQRVVMRCVKDAMRSNRLGEPMAPLRNEFSVSATRPCRGISLSR